MIRIMQVEMQKFLSFKDCSILFFSNEQKQLFTITENKNAED